MASMGLTVKMKLTGDIEKIQELGAAINELCEMIPDWCSPEAQPIADKVGEILHSCIETSTE